MWVGAVAGVLLLGWAFAQEFFIAEPVEEPRPVFDLPLVNPELAPEVGTFWLHSSTDENGVGVPYPFDPYAGLIPLYSLPGLPGQYLVADTLSDFTQMQAINLQMAQLESGGGMMSMSSLEFPGEGDTNGTGEGGSWEYTPIAYGSNDLWLELTGVTNDQGSFVLHLPSGDEAYGWDLFATTNLTLDTPAGALNLTNWTRLQRAPAGVTNLTATLPWWPIGFARLAATNDTDGDSLSDAFEALVSHSNAGTNDTDGDGLFDDWSWYYFGRATGSSNDNTRAEDDYDGDGVDNWTEQLQGTDPNDLRFTAFVGYGQTATTNPLGTVTMLGGVPAEMAVLVDSTNFNGAVWQPYTAQPTVPLPATEGPHQVWVALRARVPAEFPRWQGFKVTLDQTPPAITLTSPTNSLLQQPILQLNGWSVDNLWSLGCNVSNAAGIQSNLLGYVTGKTRGTAVTNHFQCYDLELTNGWNTITLQVLDMAGNSTLTNLSVNYDPTSDTNAPVLTPLWPRAGMKLGGSQFTLRARADDSTATVTLQTLSTNGVTNLYSGLVERTGAVWVEDVQLNSGTNWLTLTAVDAATNSITTNFYIVQSSVTATINEPTGWDSPTITVSGTIGQSGYDVWVNGIKATVQGSTWEATGVSVPDGGTGTLSIELVPEENNGEGNEGSGDPSESNPDDPDGVHLSIQPEKPALVKLVHGDWESYTLEESLLGGYYSWDFKWRWDEQSGGYAERTHVEPLPGEQVTTGLRYWVSTNGVERFETWLDDPGNIISTQAVNLGEWFWAGFSVKGPMAHGHFEQRWQDGWGYYENKDSAQDVEVMLETGGRSSESTRNLFIASAGADEKLDDDTRPIAPDALAIASFGQQSTNAQVPATHPDNTEVSVNVSAPADYYTFGVGASKHTLKLSANGVLLEPEKVAAAAEFCVGQKVVLSAAWDPPLSGALAQTSYDWTPMGDCVNKILPPITSDGSPFYVIDLTLFTNNPTSVWWHGGGEEKVWLDAKTTFTDGHEIKLLKKGLVSIYSPTARLIPIGTPTVYLTNDFLQLGASPSGLGVMSFVCIVTSKTNYPGYGNFVQLINRSGSGQFETTDDQFWLDNDPFYNTTGEVGTPPSHTRIDPVGWVDLDDNPGVATTTALGTPYPAVAIDDSFKSYLVFKPDPQDTSIWVTLGLVTWGWSGSETWNTTLTSSWVTPASYSDSTEFPNWIHTFHNNQ